MTPRKALAELREMSERATAGRLFVEPNEREIRAHGSGKPITTAIAPRKGGNRAHADMMLYACAVNALPAILTALEAAEAMSDAVGSSALQCYDDDNPKHYDECECSEHVITRAMDAFRAALARIGEKENGR